MLVVFGGTIFALDSCRVTSAIIFWKAATAGKSGDKSSFPKIDFYQNLKKLNFVTLQMYGSKRFGNRMLTSLQDSRLLLKFPR